MYVFTVRIEEYEPTDTMKCRRLIDASSFIFLGSISNASSFHSLQHLAVSKGKQRLEFIVENEEHGFSILLTLASKGPVNLSGTIGLSSVSSCLLVSLFVFAYIVPRVKTLMVSRDRAGVINAASGTLSLIKPEGKVG